MYDFSLEEGDSVYIGVPGSTFLSDSLLFTVSFVNTVFFGEYPRKILLGSATAEVATNFYHQVVLIWVEGVGDIEFHPFYSGYCLYQQGGSCPYCEDYVCLTTSQGVLYAEPDFDYCEYSDFNPTRIYVDQDVASDFQNGSNWQYAFQDLQEAIAIAEPGDSIWVAEGTYFPTISRDREIFFNLNPGVKIFGGFEGTETDLSQRDWESHETILSGDIGVTEDSTDNSYHVVYSEGTDSTAVLDGFTITRGYAIHPNSGYLGSLNRGGGMLVNTNEFFPVASPIIRNCQFRLNVGSYGGAMAFNGEYGGYANPTLDNCGFFRNKGTIEGGAIYKIGPSQNEFPSVYNSCKFEENWAWLGAGAIFMVDACNSHVFNNCTFINNESVGGGGAIFYLPNCENGSVSIVNTHFEGNEGIDSGGFGFINNGISTDIIPHYSFEVINCTFLGNEAPYGFGGGVHFATYSDSCFIDVFNSSFIDNVAGEGGGGIYLYSGSGSVIDLQINSSIFNNNRGLGYPGGGGVEIFGQLFAPDYIKTFLELNNSIFFDNRGAVEIGTGTGLAVSSINSCSFLNNGNYPLTKNWSSNFDYINNYNDFSISNSIIWEPQAPLTQVFYNGSPLNQHLFDYSIRNCLVSHPICDLPGGEEACQEGMIFEQDPMFLNEEQGDLHIGACSPAINAGNNIYGTHLTMDLDDNSRILEDVIDLGAYERTTFFMELNNIDSVSCNGGENGALQFETNGDLPLAYLWENGSITDTTVSNLSAGEYSYTITDAAGCQDTISVSISEPEIVDVNYNIQDASAFDAWDGALTLLEVSGGTPPYEWFWNTEDTVSSLENIPQGWYILNVLDANECLYTYNFEVSWVNADGEIDKSENIVVFPNPVKQGNFFQLLFPKSIDNLRVEIIDVSGKVLSTFENNQGSKLNISTRSFSAGLYWIRVVEKFGGNKILCFMVY